jgi:hypothetical protein
MLSLKRMIEGYYKGQVTELELSFQFIKHCSEDNIALLDDLPKVIRDKIIKQANETNENTRIFHMGSSVWRGATLEQIREREERERKEEQEMFLRGAKLVKEYIKRE